MIDNMSWLNEPPKWNFEGNILSVSTGYKTDFWRETFYGFIRDSGHFLYKKVKGDFTAQVTLQGNYEELYDQAGLMLRINENKWIKTGFEFTDSKNHFSTAITRDYSDWSMLHIPEITNNITIRLTRHGSAVRIQFLDIDGTWKLVRLGYLDMSNECQIGLMCCSPRREGFKAKFKNFKILEPISSNLHE